MAKPHIKTFISYSSKDKEYFEVFLTGLNNHLFTSKDYHFVSWEDSKIHVGTFWDDVIQTSLSDADIAIFCVSANFLNSKYIKAKEFGVLIEKFPQTTIVPVYFNHCSINDWDELAARQFFKPAGENYDKATKDDFAFCDLVKFRETDGKAIPNSNIDLYLKDFVRRLEASVEENKSLFCQKKLEESGTLIIQAPTNFVPKPTKDFTGRERELELFAVKYRVANLFCVEGLGGTGKSEFVAKFIENIDDDKIVWFDCKKDSSFESLIEIAGYREFLKIENNNEIATFLGLRELIERDGKVIVLDNFHEINNAQFKGFFKFLKNSLRNAKIILTSREKIIIDDIDVENFLLEGLTSDSLKYIKKIIENRYRNSISLTDEELLKICNDLHGHPFAIQLAVQLFSYADDVQNIIEIIKEYQTESDKLSNRLLHEIFNHPKSTANEKELLKHFSVYRGKVSSAAFNNILAVDFREPLRNLINKLMITLTEGGYSVHPLVREFAYLKLETKVEAHKRALEYYLAEENFSTDLTVQEEIFYHIQKSESYLLGVKYFEEHADILHNRGHYKFLKSAIGYLLENGYKSQKLIIALTDSEGALGEPPRHLELIINEAFNLEMQTLEILIEAKITRAEILSEQGKLEDPVVEFEKLIVECNNATFNKGKAVCLNNIADFYIDNGKYDLAEKYTLEAFNILKREDYLKGLLMSIKTLGFIYYKARKYSRAEEQYKLLQRVAQENENKRDLILSKNGLALLYFDKREFGRALEIFRDNLNYFIAVGDKSNQAVEYFNIVHAMMESGDSGYAEYLDRGFEISMELEKYDSISSFYLLYAKDYKAKGDYLNNIWALFSILAYNRKIKVYSDSQLSALLEIKRNIGSDEYIRLATAAYQKVDKSVMEYLDLNEMLFNPVVNKKEQGRNELCECGSGKKYKNCHGKK